MGRLSYLTARVNLFSEPRGEEAIRSGTRVSLSDRALEILADPMIAVPPGGGEAYEALGVGRSQPVRRALGEVRRLLAGEKITRTGAARKIVDIVKAFGLRKVEAAPEREEITAEDVGVVCWMGVLACE